MLFSNVRSEAASMELQILKGRAEFTFSDSADWAPAYSEQKFLEGDSIRTAGNTRISLEFLGGNMVFLNENSELQILELEEKSSGKKTVVLSLVQGEMWTHASGDAFVDDSKSKFTVQTGRLLVHVRGTIFDLSTTTTQDTLRLVKGNVDVDVFTGEGKKDFVNVKVGVGQKFVASNASLELLQAGQEVLEIIDTDFIYSEWHLQNLERFSPQEATQIRRRIEVTAPVAASAEASLPTSDDLESPTILSPQNGTRIPANQEAVQIEGTAPLKAVQIVVNGYTLTRFQPGDRKWAYFGSTKFGTLLPGENKYSVVAISRDGKKSPPAEVTVFFEGAGAVATEDVGEEVVSTIDEFKAPVVTRPTIIDGGDPYQTSSDIVTIAGIVDPKTNAIEVNGFRLQKFQPGQTEFSYIANARYGNMEKGENVYEIVAFGPDGKRATKTITVVYTPVNLESE